jgi:hypothetical protein
VILNFLRFFLMRFSPIASLFFGLMQLPCALCASAIARDEGLRCVQRRKVRDVAQSCALVIRRDECLIL